MSPECLFFTLSLSIQIKVSIWVYVLNAGVVVMEATAAFIPCDVLLFIALYPGPLDQLQQRLTGAAKNWRTASGGDLTPFSLGSDWLQIQALLSKTRVQQSRE